MANGISYTSTICADFHLRPEWDRSNGGGPCLPSSQSDGKGGALYNNSVSDRDPPLQDACNLHSVILCVLLSNCEGTRYRAACPQKRPQI